VTEEIDQRFAEAGSAQGEELVQSSVGAKLIIWDQRSGYQRLVDLCLAG
jgi:hypothetical protein